MSLFEGERTLVFWLGLIILCLASTALFSVTWSFAIVWFDVYSREYYLRSSVPTIVGGVVFIILGLYMMKSGVEVKEGEKGQV